MTEIVYLDNAATSFPKPETVYNEVQKCMRTYCANPGRGGHEMSLLSGKAVNETRESLSGLINCPNPLQIVFTKNATEALNYAIKGSIKPGCHVILTSMEHNSVVRPIKTLEREGVITVTIVEGNRFGDIDPEDVRKAIRKKTRLIACTYSSNVNGTILPVKEIADIAKQHGIYFLLDASQGLGSHPIDVQELGADYMAFPGHKGLLGPQGTGGLYIREGAPLNTLMEGGTGSHSESLFQPDIVPDRYESGTLNTPGIAGLGAAVRYINETGLSKIKAHNQKLIERLAEGFSEIKNVKIYSHKPADRNSGIIAVNILGMDSNEISYLLDQKYGIATRASLHCAPLAHRTLGTLETGIIRFSPGFFNSIKDIDFAIDAVKEIAQNG